MEGFAIVILLVLGAALFFMLNSARKTRIEQMIESIGGEVIAIEYRTFFMGIGPFMVVGKGRTVYRIIYSLNGEIKEGWVRFGGLFGPDWRL